MPPKLAKAYRTGARGKTASASRMGTLDLSPGLHHKIDDIAVETDATAKTRRTGNAHLGSEQELMGNGWSSVVGQESEPAQGEHRDETDKASVFGDLLDGPPEHLGQHSAEIADSYIWETQVYDEISSPHTVLERSLRAPHPQSTQPSAQSQRTVALLGDDFATSDDHQEQDTTIAAPPSVTQPTKVKKTVKVNQVRQRPAKQKAAPKSSKPGKLLGNSNGLFSPAQPALAQESTPTVPASQQPKKIRQIAKKTFDPSQVKEMPQKAAQRQPVKAARKPAANASKKPSRAPKAPKRKATQQRPKIDDDSDRVWELGSDYEDPPSVLDDNTQANESTKTSVSKMTVPSAVTGKAGPAAAKGTGRQAPRAKGKKRQAEEDEDYSPSQPGVVAKAVPNKKVKRHDVLETPEGIDRPTRAKVAFKGQDGRSSQKHVKKEPSDPEKPPSLKLGNVSRVDEVIIIPSDGASDSDQEEDEVANPSLMKKATSTKNPEAIASAGLTVSGGTKDNLDDHLDGTTLIDEHAIRKPQVIAFDRSGPANFGKRSPRKHQTSPSNSGPNKKARTKLRGRHEHPHNTNNGLPVTVLIETMTEDPYDSSRNETRTNRQSTSGAGRQVPDAQTLATAPSRQILDSVMNEAMDVPESQPEPSVRDGGYFAARNPTHMPRNPYRSSGRPNQMPTAAPSYLVPSRRSSRVDECGSPNAANDTFALNGAPSGADDVPPQSPEQDATGRPPPGFFLDKSATAGKARAVPLSDPGQMPKRDTHISVEPQKTSLPSLKYRETEDDQPAAAKAASRAPVATSAQKSTQPAEFVRGRRTGIPNKFTKSFKDALNTHNQPDHTNSGEQRGFARTPLSMEGARARQPKNDWRQPRLSSAIALPRPQDNHFQHEHQHDGRTELREDDMGTVVPAIVKLFLQKLKAKEGSVENVADMYARNGSALLNEVETLHRQGRFDLASRYDNRRTRYVANCGATQKRVQILREAMEKVSVSGSGPLETNLADQRHEAVEKARAKLNASAKNVGGLLGH